MIKITIKSTNSQIARCFIDTITTITLCFLYLLLVSTLLTENKRYVEKENKLCPSGYDYVKFSTLRAPENDSNISVVIGLGKLLAIQDTFCIYHGAQLDSNQISECLLMNEVLIKPFPMFLYYIVTVSFFAIFLHTSHLILIYNSNTGTKKLIHCLLFILVVILSYLLMKELAFYYFLRGCLVTQHSTSLSRAFLALVTMIIVPKLYFNKKYFPLFLICTVYCVIC